MQQALQAQQTRRIPALRGRGLVWLGLAALLLFAALAPIGPLPAAEAANGPNLAAGKSVTASGYNDVYPESKVNDGDPASYWESVNNAWPQWIEVDLGSAVTVDEVVLKLPPGWEARTQTLTVQGSADGSSYATLAASAGYAFDPAQDNVVSIAIGETAVRYVRLTFSANTGWPAAQLSELEVYGTAGGESDTQAPSAPGNLTLTEEGASGIRLEWTAASDNVGVTAYEIHAGGQLLATVGGATLSYTASAPSGTVSYYIVAKDAAGNASPPSHTVTFSSGGAQGDETNVALGKPIAASSTVHTYAAAHANDGDTSTYWEGGGQPSELTVDLGSDHTLDRVVVKLNPASEWGVRTQTIEVRGRAQDASGFASVAGAQAHAFDPAAGNTVTIPVTATVRDVRLVFTANSGAPAGQVAELEVWGTPAPNPDLTVDQLSWTPSAPSEADAITLSAVVHNDGEIGSAATDIRLYLDDTLAGTAQVGALAAGASQTVAATIDPQQAGTYAVRAVVDEDNAVIEMREDNNTATHPSALEVGAIASADLVAAASWNPGSPAAGDPVAFQVTLRNQGNQATTAGPHDLTLTLKDGQGTTLQTLTGAYSDVLAPGAEQTIGMGNWTAADGSYTVTATVSPDAGEAASKQGNNSSTKSLYVGRGANMPFTLVEAEALSNPTNGTVLAPNYELGDYAGEASGRSAVRLDATGEYVEFELTSPANAFVLRSAVAEGASGTVSLYADGTKAGAFNVSSTFSHVYATPDTLGRLGYDNEPGAGLTAYWLYEDAQLLLDQVYPAGTTIRIQLDAGDISWIYLDLIETEQVAPPAVNPDPALYVEVSATKSIEQALTEFRQDAGKQGIFIPAGEWTMNGKIYLYGRSTEIVGAGPWHTKLKAPQDQTNTDIGFNIGATANGSTIRDLSAWGNYVYRVDGPGKFIDGNGMQDVTVDNLWVEHFICLYWGVNSSNNTFTNNRIKNVFADGINMTNGSSYNLIDNNYSRGSGDDAFALFSAIDAGGSYNVGNTYSNLTATNVRRAAGFAVYGGSGNLFQNLYAADTLTYPGLTISSLSFGYNTLGFGDVDTVIDGVTLDRTGGDFWTSVGADDKINNYQNFGAIWFYGGDRAFQNILVKNVDINDPIYYGLMFQTKSPENLAMDNVRVENVSINNPGRYGIKLVVRAEQGQGPAVGEASFTNVQVNNPGVQAIYGEAGSPDFDVVRVSGNNW
ncbi:discoidin domain-containing protein [Paenibacillus sp. IB182496]|uniref:Discoidin domain-containing protein n=2 Tax=Paenibacillus sabuli TaxID=2772509 RepID=A0A927GU62_9BACL|nr:discoidin domain-containing protein [Paenibacillus sabuli]